MSGSRAPHLKRRNGIYHLRVRVPDRLRDRIGRQEICKSLQTYSPTLARSLAASVSAKVLETFAMIDELTNVTPQETRTLMQACFAEIRRQVDFGSPFAPKSDFPELELEEQLSLAQEVIARLAQQNDSGAHAKGTVDAAEGALRAKGIDLKSVNNASRLRLLDGYSRILIERRRMEIARLIDPLADYQPLDPLLRKPLPEAGVEACDVEAIGPCLGPTIADYLASKKLRWTRKTHSARVVQLGYLEDFLGTDRRLGEISAADIRRFRKTLAMLRANHGRQRHLTFQERLTENVDARLKNKTASLIFEPVKAFFRWVKEEEGLLATNPAADVRWQSIAEPKAGSTRRPFSAKEIEALFGSPLFTGSTSKHRRFQPGDEIVRDAKFWIPIIGYYTGMRLGEIVQLHVSDAVFAAEVPYFDLNEKSGSGDPKHIKTAAGIRKVPMHTDILALGFAEFVAKRRKWNKPCRRLFSEITLGADGQASTQFSKFFARLMDKVGLTDSALTFHSFRHGAEDAFRNANLQPYTIDSIMGHSDGKVSSSYGEGPSLSLKAQAVQAMKLPVSLLTILKKEGAA